MLDDTFGRSKSFTASFQDVPITNERRVRADWDGWAIVFSYDEGQEVKNDCAEIKRRLGDAAPFGMEQIDRRIHVLFADDPNREHTTQIVDVMQLLEEIPGAIVYDPKQNTVIRVRSAS